MREPIGTDAKGAQAYLGCTQHRWEILRRTRRVVPVVGQSEWFAYADLDKAMEQLRAERDKTDAKVITLPAPKKGKSEGYGSTDEILKGIAK